MRIWLAIGACGVLVGGAVWAQKVDDKFDFQPGDVFSLGPNAYPVGATYRVVDCDPVDKRYRECRVIRSDESHARPLTMENYAGHIELVSRGAAPAPAAAPPAIAQQPPRPQPRPPVTVMGPPPAPAAVAPGNNGMRECTKTPYGGIVKSNVAASPALFKRKIADTITMGNTDRGWYGVTLTNFSVGAPIGNATGQLPGGGISRVDLGAPVGATLYPVSTTMTVCEGWNGGSGSWRTSAKKYICFVNANREWTCGASN